MKVQLQTKRLEFFWKTFLKPVDSDPKPIHKYVLYSILWVVLAKDIFLFVMK